MLWTEWLMSSVRRLAKALIGSPMLGPEHPLSKVTSINDLALLLYTTAALEATGQTLLGPEHLSTTVIYVNNDLPVLLMYMAAALAALEASEQALGPEHRSTMPSINNLALLLYTTVALEATGQALLAAGPKRPSATVIYLNNELATLLMYTAALEANEWTLGPQCPDTLIYLNDMALPLQDRRRQLQKVAEPLRGGVAHWRRRRRRRRWRLPTTTTWWWWQ